MQPFDDHHHIPSQQEKEEHHFSYRLLQGLLIGLCALSLLGCISNLSDAKPEINPESKDINPENRLILERLYDNKSSATTEYFPAIDNISFDNYHSNSNEPSDQQTVSVPDSYHLGLSNTPPASKDEDRSWIKQQSPNDYTIQVAQSTKPAQVANTLQQLPRSNHNAEVRTQSGPYVGLHGSYATRVEAEEAFNKLPPTIKANAQVKNWQSVQNEVQ